MMNDNNNHNYDTDYKTQKTKMKKKEEERRETMVVVEGGGGRDNRQGETERVRANQLLLGQSGRGVMQAKQNKASSHRGRGTDPNYSCRLATSTTIPFFMDVFWSLTLPHCNCGSKEREVVQCEPRKLS